MALSYAVCIIMTAVRPYLGRSALGLAAESLSVPVGIVAVVIGPHRVAAFAGLLIAAAYFLYFTGMILVFLTSRG